MYVFIVEFSIRDFGVNPIRIPYRASLTPEHEDKDERDSDTDASDGMH